MLVLEVLYLLPDLGNESVLLRMFFLYCLIDLLYVVRNLSQSGFWLVQLEFAEGFVVPDLSEDFPVSNAVPVMILHQEVFLEVLKQLEIVVG